MPAAKAVVVFDPTGKPLTNCVAQLNGVYSPLTNSDGYGLFGQNFNPGPTYIIVYANGYKSYIQPVTLADINQNILIGGNSTDPENINLPPLSFNQPSRDSIINVKANFCNLYDAQGIPIFEPFISTLIIEDEARAEDWVSRLRNAGSTHLTLNLSGDYPEPLGWAPRYPIAGHDWTNDILGFSQIIDWVQSHNFIPFIKLATDGLAYDPNGWTYGWQWGMDNLPRILGSLSNYHNSCLWSTGWDGCFPTWSRDQTIQMIQMLRLVLGTGCIDTEFAGPGSIGYCHMGGGAADWSDDKLGMLDCFSTELETNPAQADGISQTATRLLGPAATNCPQTPYYLANTTKKINMCFFETVAYWFIHKLTADYKTPANLGAYYGFTSFGNGLPG